MTIQTQQLERAFRYNSVDLPDPGPQYTPEQVRDFFAPTYPEILNAAIEGPEEKDGKLVYTFRRAVGTKGADAAPDPMIELGGAARIGAERARQLHVKRWSKTHDDDHTDHSLALAACAYAAPERLYRLHPFSGPDAYSFVDAWPKSWAPEYDHREREGSRLLDADETPIDRRIRALEKAGALIAAEIDRLLRLKAKKASAA